ncbi:MAG: hypothetical protein FJ267_00550, partial [Planctomycetes bacterium]|nr:hypothetical protein [Planctomycetota bacterium]
MSFRPFLIRVVGLALVALTAAIYWPVLSYDFVNIDDGIYVVFNAIVKQGLTMHGWMYAWTQFVCANWHPLTILSYELDGAIWVHNPAGYHLTNLVLHSINVCLVYVALHQMTHSVFRSAFVAAFFGLHPLHVESVAWISERKDVLSTFFLLLTL